MIKISKNFPFLLFSFTQCQSQGWYVLLFHFFVHFVGVFVVVFDFFFKTKFLCVSKLASNSCLTGAEITGTHHQVAQCLLNDPSYFRKVLHLQKNLGHSTESYNIHHSL
jgi:hypothetical protein